MPHLVKPIVLEASKPMPVEQCLTMVQAAHDYLVKCGKSTIEQTQIANNLHYWGSQVKRIQADLDGDNRPELIDNANKKHNLIELLNQCATMERLIDALIWINECLPDYQVVRCHPTTSSIQQNLTDSIPDNDIVLINDTGQFARFEVSDVIGRNDSNGKEKKDLQSLGVYTQNVWAKGRLFLVTSKELANRILTRKPTQIPPYRYEAVKDEGLTRIFEVLPAAI